MALVRCILGKFIGVICHCFPPRLDVPTFAARCLHVHNDARDSSSERWNYGRKGLFFYIEAKFGPIERKRTKTIDINRDEIFQNNSPVHPLLTTKGIKEILEQLKVEPVDEKIRRYK